MQCVEAGNSQTRAGAARVLERSRTSITILLADGSEHDCLTGIHLAREAHRNMIFRDIPFSQEVSTKENQMVSEPLENHHNIDSTTDP